MKRMLREREGAKSPLSSSPSGGQGGGPGLGESAEAAEDGLGVVGSGAYAHQTLAHPLGIFKVLGMGEEKFSKPKIGINWLLRSCTTERTSSTWEPAGVEGRGLP